MSSIQGVTTTVHQRRPHSAAHVQNNGYRAATPPLVADNPYRSASPTMYSDHAKKPVGGTTQQLAPHYSYNQQQQYNYNHDAGEKGFVQPTPIRASSSSANNPFKSLEKSPIWKKLLKKDIILFIVSISLAGALLNGRNIRIQHEQTKSFLETIRSDMKVQEKKLKKCEKNTRQMDRDLHGMSSELRDVHAYNQDMSADNQKLHEELVSIRDERRMHHSVVHELQRENRYLRDEITDYRKELERHHITHVSTRNKVSKLDGKVVELRKNVQATAKREVINRFGAGPHRVDVHVNLPDGNQMSDRYFTIELASLDLMPHSVHIFLQQVSQKLWNGCSFVINAGHVLQASPVPADDHSEEDMLLPFQKAGLETVSFQEYHESYPHVEWTVGFSGRPGGPDFYINTFDNRDTHGPKGTSGDDDGDKDSTSAEDDEEADPCFGKVVGGLDTIHAIRRLETDGDMLVHRVVITNMMVYTENGGSEIDEQ